MKKLARKHWLTLLLIVSPLLIAVLVFAGVGLSQSTPQEQLIEDLRGQGIPVLHEPEFIDLIDSICPTIDTSYVGLAALEAFMTQEQALDTLAVVRYSGYCNSI